MGVGEVNEGLEVTIHVAEGLELRLTRSKQKAGGVLMAVVQRLPEDTTRFVDLHFHEHEVQTLVRVLQALSGT